MWLTRDLKPKLMENVSLYPSSIHCGLSMAIGSIQCWIDHGHFPIISGGVGSLWFFSSSTQGKVDVPKMTFIKMNSIFFEVRVF